MEPNHIGPGGPTNRPSASAQAGGAGRVVTVERRYLGLDDLGGLRPGRPPALPTRLERLTPCPVETWRALYRQIGDEWHWHDRDAWDDRRIQLHLDRAEVQVYRVMVDDLPQPERPAGFLELERHPDGAVEIVYLGIDRRAFGLGLGGWLLAEAVRTAFADGARRVWLHTCTLDAPAALPNYVARGFTLERTETYQTTVAD